MKLLFPVLGLLFCFGVSCGASAQVQWRLSDALGTDRGQAPGGKTSGWVLKVEPRPQGERRILLQDGVVQSEKLVDLDRAGRVVRIRDLRGGLPVWEVTYDAEAGQPTTETAFEDGHPTEVATLEFRQRVLYRRTVKDADGTLLYVDTLERWPDGVLRRLERDGPEGSLAESAWSYSPGGSLARAWMVDEQTKAEGGHRETVYTPGKTEETLGSSTATLVTRVTERLESGGSRETTTDPTAQKVQKRLFDAQGRLVQEVTAVKDVVTQTRRWLFDEKGRVVEASTESAGPRELWTYAYQDNTSVARLTRGGTLVREEVTQDGEKVSVSLFDRGSLFLEETWTGGKKTKETYYQKGAAVRERTP